MNIHYFQHVPYEGLGHIDAWARENGHKLTCTRFFDESWPLPELSEIDALIILGGPMNVFDEAHYAWLTVEKQFIKAAIDSGKKILGICLGAQLLANVLGAAVKPAPNKEIGWFPVVATDEAKALSWFSELFAAGPTVFHWHADKFEIPYESINLASSEGNKNQAFAVGDQILALQFHVETTFADVQTLLENARADVIPGNFVQPEAALFNDSALASSRQLCNDLLSRFFR
ncbi:type 1 glutamine amidotransferase [Parapedobacter sp. 10938]|uniref:type 1 glutamine amidotransferase n=1 Tax=Parapedobacter flavus TaxID=3110225 RepID=UPI002DBB5EC9|nr:type 1 glutamine amidotransferase [Parapedobacter sp. 10938]MEC3881688.1 type 1 glutamine amidotransferase [Parapedobacter sp. 10938]